MKKRPESPAPARARRMLADILNPGRPVVRSTLVELWRRRTFSDAASDVAARRLAALRDEEP
jgi:hypothetical protein